MVNAVLGNMRIIVREVLWLGEPEGEVAPRSERKPVFRVPESGFTSVPPVRSLFPGRVNWHLGVFSVLQDGGIKSNSNELPLGSHSVHASFFL